MNFWNIILAQIGSFPPAGMGTVKSLRHYSPCQATVISIRPRTRGDYRGAPCYNSRMAIPGLGLLGCIFLSFGCLVSAIKSLASLSQAYDRESRITAIMGFIGGMTGSIIFGLATIYMVNKMAELNPLTGENM